jgi:hypothetical protein
MASPRTNWFAPFEGTRHAAPVALFRVAFFSGLALHFAPSLLWLGESYRPGALRSQEWNHWLFAHFTRLPHGVVVSAAIATLCGCAMGIVGLRPRLAAILAGVGCYTFASFNSMPVQTLAIVDAWAILLAWMICGGGAAVWSLDALLARRPSDRREPKLLSALVLFQVLLAVFFSGIEKLLAGWPFSNEMGVVLGYPKGFLVRDWVAASSLLHAPAITRALSWLTVLVELGTPPLLLVRRARIAALIAYELFFFGIIAMLEVPPLFYCMFAFGGLLALDDAQVERLIGWLRRAA